MPGQEGKYNIKAAALKLGIQPGTLRAWERRYQMIAPVRNAAGHRLYTEEHIKILKWLINKVDQGFTISQAISLMENSQSQMNLESINLKQANQMPNLSDELYDALIHFETEKANDVINTMFITFTIEKVLVDIFKPILIKIEDSFAKGKIVKSQSYFSSKLLKTRMAAIIQSLPYNTHLSKAITVSTPGDEDNIELLMMTLFLRKHGVEVIDIGDVSSEEELFNAINIIEPDLFVITCAKEENLSGAMSLISQIARNVKDLQIGLVGEAVNTLRKTEWNQFSNFLIGQTPNEWNTWLLKAMRL